MQALWAWIFSWLRPTYSLYSPLTDTTTCSPWSSGSASREKTAGVGLITFSAWQHRWSAGQIDWWDTCAIYCGEANNDTIAQVVKCTPVIVLHQADEITLFRWHPTCPYSAGALGRWHVLFFSPHTPPPSNIRPPPSLPVTHDALHHKWVETVSQGLSPWQRAMSAHRKTRSVSCGTMLVVR